MNCVRYCPFLGQVQQDQQYGHRPVFYCALTDMHLFYHAAHGQWQIYKHPSTRAHARLKTKRSPQIALGANWEIRQQTGTEATYNEARVVPTWQWENHFGRSKTVSFLFWFQDPDMSCNVLAPPSSVDEMIARAPKHLYVEAADSKIQGGFSKNDQPWNERPSWFNKEDKTFLIYDKDKVCWKICTAPQDDTAVLGCSRPSSVWSPELIRWENGLAVKAVDLRSRAAKEILE